MYATEVEEIKQDRELGNRATGHEGSRAGNRPAQHRRGAETVGCRLNCN
jgi:hypothetical protein